MREIPQPGVPESKPVDPIDRAITALVETPRKRREIFGLTAGAAGALILAACGGRKSGDIPSTPTVPVKPRGPEPTAVPLHYELPQVFPEFPVDAILKPVDRLKKVGRKIRAVSENAKKTLLDFTNGYSPEPPEKADGFKGLRKLALSEQTAREMLTSAETKGEPVELNHDAVVVEVEHLKQYADLRERIGEGMLDVYADGIIAGLHAYGDLSKPRVIALEAGHMSKLIDAEKKKADQAKVEWTKKPHGRNDRYIITADTGAILAPQNGKPALHEPDVNIALCQIIAAKLMDQYPQIIPILNTDEKGYPIARSLTPSLGDTVKNTATGGEDTYYARNIDAIGPMFDQWRKLAATLKASGVPMTRLSIHFEGAEDPSEKGGRVITPNFGPQKETSDKLAQAIAVELETAVKPYIPSYKQEVRRDLNKKGEEYWMLSAYPDNPGDVKKGEKNKVFGPINKWIAGLRCGKPGSVAC